MDDTYDDIEYQPKDFLIPPEENDIIKRRKSEDKVARAIAGSDEWKTSNHRKNAQRKGKLGKSGIWVTLCILVTELCERLTYYGVSGNLLIFCSKILNIGSDSASSIVLSFTGASYVIPIFGGWIADSFLGKFNTIYGSALIYFVGTVMLTIIALPFTTFFNIPGLSDKYKQALFAIALLLISCGTGGIKSNVSPFGAEQVQSHGPEAVRTFFSWFYWFINVGSFISYSLVVYLQTDVTNGFFWGFLVPTIAILIGLIIFVCGKRHYLYKPPNGSLLTVVCRIIWTGIRRRWQLRKQPSRGEQSTLDYARIRFRGPYTDGQVDTVIALLRILPIYATMILYWTVYFQMQTSFLLQALYMNLKIGSFDIPPASLSLVDTIIILVLIPITDRIIYPLFNKCRCRNTQLRRIGFGMIFAAFSVVIAGYLEQKRRETVTPGYVNHVSSKTYNASRLTVLYQVPQFLMIGSSEVFASITGLEFAYSQSPRMLQGVVMGLFLMTSGLGSFVGAALINIVTAVNKKWYPDDLNKGNLEYFFYLLAVIMLINFLIFCVVARWYTYVTPQTLQRGEVDWKLGVDRRSRTDTDSEYHISPSPNG